LAWERNYHEQDHCFCSRDRFSDRHPSRVSTA
jgi:hypothetical protein